MSSIRLTKEKEIGNTRAILRRSYDLSSGGIPPHASLLEGILNERPLTDYEKKTFLSLRNSNLLSIPSIALYFSQEDRDNAVAYFGEDFANELSDKLINIGMMASKGGVATVHYFCFPEKPLNFTLTIMEMLPMFIEECIKKDIYLCNLSLLTSGL